MRVSAEGFLLASFVMNFLVLFSACRGTWFLRIRRLLAASAFGAICALLDALSLLPGWLSALSMALMLICAFPLRDFRLFSKTALFSMCVALMSSGLIRAFFSGGAGRLASSFLGTALGCLLAVLLKGQLPLPGVHREVRVRAGIRGRAAEFTALIDTGNLLTEPISALPVLIADEKALGRAFFREGGKSDHTRRVEFGSVGGGGTMLLLKPDRMEMHNGRMWVLAPEMWLGLYPGRMNRGVHALAPGAAFSVFSQGWKRG